jgi:hypothetical protein
MTTEIIFDSPQKSYWITTVNKICKSDIILKNDSINRVNLSK